MTDGLQPRSAARESIPALCRRAGERLVQGQYTLAEALYRMALTLEEEVHGTDSIEVALVCSNLGVVCKYIGNIDEAERLYRRALEIQEKLLGPEHPDLAPTFNNLAVLTRAQGHYEELEAIQGGSGEENHWWIDVDGDAVQREHCGDKQGALGEFEAAQRWPEH